MDKETIDYEDEEEDYDLDDLLNEEDDSPVEEDMAEETPAEEDSEPKVRKTRGRPKGTTKERKAPEAAPEVLLNEKELNNMEWQPYVQQAYEGLQNNQTGEIIDINEAVRRTLCYAQEAARNSR